MKSSDASHVQRLLCPEPSFAGLVERRPRSERSGSPSSVARERRASQRQQDGGNHAQRRALSASSHQTRQVDPDQIAISRLPRKFHRGATRGDSSPKGRFLLATGSPNSQAFFPRGVLPTKKRRPKGRRFSSPRCDQRPSAAIPALATCASSFDLTPLTPTAPITWPSLTIGTPPSSMPCMPGAVRNAVRPPLMMSS